MGGGIAMACANAGLAVVLEDTDQAAIDKGLSAIRRNYETSVSRGRLTSRAAEERLARIDPQVGYAAARDADLVVEAVFENLDLKKRVFHELDSIATTGRRAGDATHRRSTSTRSRGDFAAGRGRGAAFLQPGPRDAARRNRPGRGLLRRTLATAMAFAKRLGKVPVVVGNCRGFVGNRMMFPYMYEAQFIVEEGATPEQVDRALTDFGMAMGIFAVDDMAGSTSAGGSARSCGQFSDPAERRPLVPEALNQLGRFGQKTGAGWYRYDESRNGDTRSRRGRSDRRSTAREAGIPAAPFTDDEIVERTIYAMINEGARVLEEGFAAARVGHRHRSTSTATAFPPGAAVRCSSPITSACAVVHERVAAFHARVRRTVDAGAAPHDRCEVGRTFRERVGVVGEHSSPPTRHRVSDADGRNSGDRLAARARAVSGEDDRSARALGGRGSGSNVSGSARRPGAGVD